MSSCSNQQSSELTNTLDDDLGCLSIGSQGEVDSYPQAFENIGCINGSDKVAIVKTFGGEVCSLRDAEGATVVEELKRDKVKGCCLNKTAAPQGTVEVVAVKDALGGEHLVVEEVKGAGVKVCCPMKTAAPQGTVEVVAVKDALGGEHLVVEEVKGAGVKGCCPMKTAAPQGTVEVVAVKDALGGEHLVMEEVNDAGVIGCSTTKLPQTFGEKTTVDSSLAPVEIVSGQGLDQGFGGINDQLQGDESSMVTRSDPTVVYKLE